MEQKLKEISLHLLDLGKRNRLINYKTSGYRSIEILNEDIEDLFKRITNGNLLSIFSLDPVLQKYHTTIEGMDSTVEEYSIGKVKDIALPLLKANDVLCYKKGIPLQKLLKALYREYKNTLLEKGINTLYMSFGMIEYKEGKDSYLAPLLLIPLEFTMNPQGYKIKESEDEIVLNPTLAYLLKSEFKIELEPFDEKTMTLSEYFSKIISLLSEAEFKLYPRISMGIYSFLKMNMFNDLTNHMDIILENVNIQKLLGATPEDLPLEVGKSLPVVDADQSQLEAIEYATQGKSFVLQGPPGTGKSQTITNMISSLIGNGKKVLFVSEKQAALNVVYENLRRAGLDSFALELHSHKANKKEFIEELYKTALLPKYDIKEDAEDYQRKHSYLTEKLEEYRTLLHKRIDRVQRSMYEVYAAYLSTENTNFDYPIPNIKALDIEALESISKGLDQYALLSASLGYDYHKGPFYGFICKDIMYIKYEAKSELQQLCHFYQALLDIQAELKAALPFEIKSYKHIVDAMPYVDRIIQINYFLPDYFIADQRERLCKRIECYKDITSYIHKSSLKKFLDLKILKLENLEQVTSELSRFQGSIFKILKPSYHKLKNLLSPYIKFKMKDEDLIYKLEEAIEYRNKLATLQKLSKQLPDHYRPSDYDVLYQDACSLKELPFSLNLTEETYEKLKRRLLDIVIHFRKIHTLDLSHYVDKFDAEVIELATGDLKSIYNHLKDMEDSIDLLDLHAQRLDVLNKLAEYQMMPFLDQALERKIPLKKLSTSYIKSFWQANILYEVEDKPIFKEFAGLEIVSMLDEFKELDQKHLEANKALIVSLLSNQRPDESIMIGSRFSVLVKEYNKNRKQKPIRLLLEEIFDLILDIKPVFLMSPLSVSTYLNSKLNLFDTVIFDEASQVFAWDALGAIYRAKQCIIIGDSKQMPPSNFFTSLIEEEDDYENDMESILDKGSTIFPTKRLNWHYRSRSEELIAFSNKEFYENKLITIPQARPHSSTFGVDFQYVYGTYEVKARTNLIEAKHITRLVLEHAKTRLESSLGVVAFSNAQADLIRDFIEEALEEESELKDFFSEDRKEPFFVKNLESVQGDERDVIIFSICYGYTKENKFYQRFGPLNVLGGERRLNVAVTRAKENVIVVSSIKASDIRLESTESLGVAALKKYLAYAEASADVQHKHYTSTDGVIQSIVQFLTKAGYQVQTQIGTSAFTIDIAVMNPNTNEYTLAIMLDGPSYLIGNCSDANALQERLLKRLGWKFLRIFSTHWIHQSKLEQDRVLKYIKDCFESKEITEKKKVQKENLLVKIEDTFDDSFKAYRYVPMEEIERLYNHKKPTEVIRYIISKEEPIHMEYLLKRICFMYGRTKVTSLVKEYFEKDIEGLHLYREQDFLSIHPIGPMGLRISSDRSIEYIHQEELKDAILKVVKKSNGITKEGCFKKVVALIGYNRMSENAYQLLDQALVFLKLDGVIIEKQDCLYI